MFDEEPELEINEDEFDAANCKMMATHHHEEEMNHCQALKTERETCGHEPYVHLNCKRRSIAAHMHRLAADLYRNGKLKDADFFGVAADRLTDRIEMNDWE